VAEAGAEAHPPILVGGGFPQAARRAIRYGDGWCPVGRTGSSLLDVSRNTGRWRQTPGAIPKPCR
jgi:alkanesulfonate monooxygenase SsuD/methylene tetrahydromethanopterin reductase-like flavin-dependent oxidoreductase (luciferase family)